MERQYGSDSAARRRRLDRIFFAFMCLLTAGAVLAAGVKPAQWMEFIEGFTRACRQVSVQTAQVPEGQMVIHMIDVGQGDSVLVQTAEANILIDAGETGKGDEVLAYLESAGVRRLDWAVCTHPHSDHLGGMSEVLESIRTDNVMLPVIPEGTEVTDRYYIRLLETIEKRKLAASVPEIGAEYTFGELKMKVLWPAGWQFSEDINDWSLVLRFSFGELDYLCCGDLTERGETQLLMSGANVEAEIIKGSHHGSAYSGCDEFLSAAAPELALISCGEGNDYQHPHDSLLRRYRKHGIKWKRTDVLGDIRVVCEGGEYIVES